MRKIVTFFFYDLQPVTNRRTATLPGKKEPPMRKSIGTSSLAVLRDRRSAFFRLQQ